MPLRPQPKQIESISVKGLVDAADGTLHLTLACGEKGLTRVIRDKSINRPALTLTGFFKNFGAKRIQLFGAGEMALLRAALDPERLRAAIDAAGLRPGPRRELLAKLGIDPEPG